MRPQQAGVGGGNAVMAVEVQLGEAGDIDPRGFARGDRPGSRRGFRPWMPSRMTSWSFSNFTASPGSLRPRGKLNLGNWTSSPAINRWRSACRRRCPARRGTQTRRRPSRPWAYARGRGSSCPVRAGRGRYPGRGAGRRGAWRRWSCRKTTARPPARCGLPSSVA